MDSIMYPFVCPHLCAIRFVESHLMRFIIFVFPQPWPKNVSCSSAIATHPPTICGLPQCPHPTLLTPAVCRVCELCFCWLVVISMVHRDVFATVAGQSEPPVPVTTSQVTYLLPALLSMAPLAVHVRLQLHLILTTAGCSWWPPSSRLDNSCCCCKDPGQLEHPFPSTPT